MRSFALRPRLVLTFITGFCFMGVPAVGSGAQSVPAPAPRSPLRVAPIPPTSALLIVDSLDGAVAGDSDASLQRRINTHAVTLASAAYLHRMISNQASATRKTHWFQGSDDPIERTEWLRQHMAVRVVPGTSLIQVSLDGVTDAAERTTILEEICSTYLDSQRALHTEQALDQTSILNNVRIKIEARLKDIRSDMREKQVRLNIDGAVGMTGNRLGVQELQLSKLVAEQIEAQLQFGRLQGFCKALAAKQDPDSAELYLLDARFAPFLKQDRQELHKLEMARDQMIDEVGAQNVKVKQLAGQVRKMQADIQKQLKDAHAAHLEDAKMEAEAAEAKVKSLTARVDSLKEEMGDLSNSLAVYTALQTEEMGLVKALKEVKDQILKATAASGNAAPAGIRWHVHPEAPAGK